MTHAEANGTVLVVGSANMDLVVTTERLPADGETVLGEAFGMYPGGKGANQAAASARLGARVRLLAKFGADLYGRRLRDTLHHAGVDLSHLLVDERESTGVALITVDAAGQNRIIVVAGSNRFLSPQDIRENRAAFSEAHVAALQLEIPLETVVEAARTARAAGAEVILNPAPARRLPDTLMHLVDYLTPNESEASMLTGMDVTDPKTAERAAHVLLDRGVPTVIVTMGAEGVLLVRSSASRRFSAHPVQPVDTTAAGDAFNGALAFGLAAGRDVEDAIAFANGAAALAVTRRGAQTSLPSFEEVQLFLDQVERRN